MTYTWMETVPQAIERLGAEGYTIDWSATDNGLLHCSACGTDIDPTDVEIHQTVRFEGASDPDDQVVILAITAPCDHSGYFVSAYGPDMQPNAVAVVQALSRR